MAVNTVPDGYLAPPIIAMERTRQVFEFLARVFGAELVDQISGEELHRRSDQVLSGRRKHGEAAAEG